MNCTRYQDLLRPLTSFHLLFILLSTMCINTARAQVCSFTLARLKYNGGGDWYANHPPSLLVRK
jgi:hypothetical protein